MATLTKTLETLYQAHDRYQVLKDWFKLTAISINNRTDLIHDQRWDKYEQEYLDTIKKYTKEEIDVFTKATAQLTLIIKNAVEEGKYQDWLGDLYMRSCTQSEEKAQFFTPYSVGKMMADLNIKPDLEELKKQDIITFNDPCVGGGCLPIAYCAALIENKINYTAKSIVFAEDNDERCFYMTYIQLSLLGCPAVIQLKDTLLNKNLGMTWHTPALKLQWLRFRNHIPKPLRATQ